jgi:hypothetical protein
VITRDQAYQKLRQQRYIVDETFQPDHGGLFCLGWKWVGNSCFTVLSDGSVEEMKFSHRGADATYDSTFRYEPGDMFPEVELPHGK